MNVRIGTVTKGIPIVMVASVVALVVYANWRDARATRTAATVPGAQAPLSTSRDGLINRIAAQEARLTSEPGDTDAAVNLADALLRQARVAGNAGLTVKAERALLVALEKQPTAYQPLRMLGAVYLSQHRFREAIASATKAIALQPADSWNYGVLGDAHLELGEYDQ